MRVKLLLLGLILVILGIAAFLLFQRMNYHNAKLEMARSRGNNEELSPLWKVYPGNPISKGINKNRETVVWEVKAVVKRPFIYKSGLLEGTIVIQQDKNEIEMNTFLGNLDGTLILGLYDEEIGKGNVSWITTDQTAVESKLTTGRPVLLRINWYGNGIDDDNRLRQLESIFDTAGQSFADGRVSVPKEAGSIILTSIELGMVR